MHLTEAEITLFRNHIWSFYKTQGRVFSWRQTHNPYHIVVSEVMLQQTQTQRVIEKYEEFIAAFPTWKELADASIHDVLTVCLHSFVADVQFAGNVFGILAVGYHLQ